MMRPTTASASKTHDKPDSPPRKGAKAPVGALQKGKAKVEEVAAKAKDAITSNGHAEDDSKSNGTPVSDEAANEYAQPGASEEPAQETAPAEVVDAPTTPTQSARPVGETAVH
jgi:hypothetical protein